MHFTLCLTTINPLTVKGAVTAWPTSGSSDCPEAGKVSLSQTASRAVLGWGVGGGGGGGLGSVCVDTEAASGNFLPPSASTFCLVLQPALVRKWVETQTVEVDFTHSGAERTWFVAGEI